MSLPRIELPGLRFHATPDGRVQGLSAACAALEGLGTGRWSDGSILVPASGDALRAALRSPHDFSLNIALQTGTPGHRAWFRCSGHWQPSLQQHVCLLADISDLYPTEREHPVPAATPQDQANTRPTQATSQQRLHCFLAASSDAVVIHDAKGIIDANPAACRLLSASVEWLRSRRFADIVAPEDRNVYLALAARGAGETLACRLTNRWGEPIEVGLLLRSTRSAGRGLQLVIVRDVDGMQADRETQAKIRSLVRDLSAQKHRAEQANRSKSRFLSAASHDLRQPIHALGLMLASLEALVMRPSVPREVLDDLTRRMGISIEALSRLLNALLEVSRLDANAVSVQAQPIALATLLDQLETEYQDMANARGLRLDVVQTDAWVMADPTVLKRILDKFVTNAVFYTPEGRVMVAARSRGDEIEIQVWDTGIGIAPDQLDAIFDEFYQPTAPARVSGVHRGLGLGLSIAKRSAALMGARLRVRSQEWRGSMFSVTLPRATAQWTPAPSLDDQAPAEPVEINTRHVLVIDDDKTVLMAMQQLLNAWGHQVWCAADPDQAIVMAINHAQDIDLVLSDFHLGEHGVASQFIDVVRACLARPVPMYVFTADTSVQVANEVHALGLSLLNKPVRDEALRQILAQCPA